MNPIVSTTHFHTPPSQRPKLRESLERAYRTETVYFDEEARGNLGDSYEKFLNSGAVDEIIRKPEFKDISLEDAIYVLHKASYHQQKHVIAALVTTHNFQLIPASELEETVSSLEKETKTVREDMTPNREEIIRLLFQSRSPQFSQISKTGVGIILKRCHLFYEHEIREIASYPHFGELSFDDWIKYGAGIFTPSSGILTVKNRGNLLFSLFLTHPSFQSLSVDQYGEFLIKSSDSSHIEETLEDSRFQKISVDQYGEFLVNLSDSCWNPNDNNHIFRRMLEDSRFQKISVRDLGKIFKNGYRISDENLKIFMDHPRFPETPFEDIRTALTSWGSSSQNKLEICLTHPFLQEEPQATHLATIVSNLYDDLSDYRDKIHIERLLKKTPKPLILKVLHISISQIPSRISEESDAYGRFIQIISHLVSVQDVVDALSKCTKKIKILVWNP